MPIVEFDIERIYGMDIEELYTILRSLVEDNPKLKSVLDKVTAGIKMKFNINWIFKGWYDEFPATHKVRVRGLGLGSLEVFIEEVNSRKDLLIKSIIENMQPKERVGVFGEEGGLGSES